MYILSSVYCIFTTVIPTKIFVSLQQYIKRHSNTSFFPGHVISGLKVYPDREHLVYPLGSTVIVKRITDGKQEFLHGHTNNVSCLSVSRSGLYVASGQVNFMAFKVDGVKMHSFHCKIRLSPNRISLCFFLGYGYYMGLCSEISPRSAAAAQGQSRGTGFLS